MRANVNPFDSAAWTCRCALPAPAWACVLISNLSYNSKRGADAGCCFIVYWYWLVLWMICVRLLQLCSNLNSILAEECYQYLCYKLKFFLSLCIN